MFSNWFTASATSASPPDIILEVGPLPFTRFAAHSSLLAIHSEYLRSAIRPSDHTIDTPIFVPSITADQFAPLLTYMYTGFLDLNIENIFSVLLATHLLHMPRALEICRTFLARIQMEAHEFPNHPPIAMPSSHPINSDIVKVIRPIATKATASSLTFIVSPIPKPFLTSYGTPFRSLKILPDQNRDCVDVGTSHQSIEVSRISTPTSSTSKNDTSSKQPDEFRTTPMKKTHRSHKRFKKQKYGGPVIENADPESPQNLDDNNSDKTIIDVASCDGPVRFQRVLNMAYHQFPVQSKVFENSSSSSSSSSKSHSNNRFIVVNSFHMQMARNITEHHSLTSGDSENSLDNIVHEKLEDDGDSNQRITTSNKTKMSNVNVKNEEIYSCIYCKNTFKSQYCYQKHAKRHINSLSLGDNETHSVLNTTALEHSRPSGAAKLDTMAPTSTEERNFTREVRPLDMNVQYYPCKTCGSKFPSYYFVHKHRKVCHTNEEN